MNELQQLKIEEASDSRRARPNNSSAISDEDRRNLELAKRPMSLPLTRNEVINLCESMGMYSPQTANYLRGGGIPGYDLSADKATDE